MTVRSVRFVGLLHCCKESIVRTVSGTSGSSPSSPDKDGLRSVRYVGSVLVRNRKIFYTDWL